MKSYSTRSANLVALVLLWPACVRPSPQAARHAAAEPRDAPPSALAPVAPTPPSASAVVRLPSFLGCWTITRVGPLTHLRVGQELCLAPAAFVVRNSPREVTDGWLVRWAAGDAGDAWQAEVIGREGPLPVSFTCRSPTPDQLQVLGSGGFTNVEATRSGNAVDDTDVRLRDGLYRCWRCQSDALPLVTNSFLASLMAENWYTISSCREGASNFGSAIRGKLPSSCAGF